MRHHLMKLDLLCYDSILVLSNEGDQDQSGLDQDSKAISTLILIRDIQTAMHEDAGASPRAPKRGTDGLVIPQMVTEDDWTRHFHRVVESTQARFTPTLRPTLVNPSGVWAGQVVAEILDSETKALMHDTSTFGSESIMSNELISMYIAMVAECQEVNSVLQELMSAEGASLELEPISVYLDLACEPKMDLWSLMWRARERLRPSHCTDAPGH